MTSETAERHVVAKGEWLSKIASLYGFRDGGAAIWDANPAIREKAHDNPDVLYPGWVLTIPPRQLKSLPMPTDVMHRIQIKNQQPKNLILTLLSPREAPSVGDPLSGWHWRVVIGPRTYDGTTGASGRISIEDIPDDTEGAQLELWETTLFGTWKFKTQCLALLIGELDPIAGEDGRISPVQRLLANQGLYSGPIDGCLGTATRAAIRSFQTQAGLSQVNGLPDLDTCGALEKAQGNRIAVDPPSGHPADPPERTFEALALGKRAANRAPWTSQLSKYLEPTGEDQSEKAELPLGEFRLFPKRVYVAPCTPGHEDQSTNNIRLVPNRFLFLDCGRWISDEDHRDFGLIWGPHVYLCRYVHEGGAPLPPDSPRLDSAFLRGMGGFADVQTRALAYWADESDFNWNKLYLFIPDLHLLGPREAQGWFPKATAYAWRAEQHLERFAHLLVKLPRELRSILQIIQLGDSHDLWVGRSKCFFKDNAQRQFTWTESPSGPSKTTVQTLVDWIREIQQLSSTDSGDTLGNPAERALHVLESGLGSQYPVVYLWGNHDNYLSQQEITSAAGILPRRRFFEESGIFVEHGHRLESRFLANLPANHDGTTKGYHLTQGLYNKASRGGKLNDAMLIGGKYVDKLKTPYDQRQYWNEQAQVYLGRQSRGIKQPHIFVIGHTHLPNLYYVDAVQVDAARLGRPAIP